ncbi:MAG: hypothetical protein QOG43_778, partial [Actinomycetota bacterium]|nr:hypothetical protein [Actinomycetota bacterium]
MSAPRGRTPRGPGTGSGPPVGTVDRVTDAGAQAARDLAARLTRRPATTTASRAPAAGRPAARPPARATP